MEAAHLRSKQVRQRGDVIRELRRRDGRRVSELARDCDLKTAQALTNIENETQQGSWEVLHRIARELAVPVRMILRNPEELDEPARVSAA